MESAWFVPDADGWREELDYNPVVADALRLACDRLGARKPMGGEILECVAPVLRAEMSRSQRLRVLYIVSACLAAQDKPSAAIEPIDDALTLALDLNETHAQTELLLLRAYVNRYTNQIPEAAEDLRACLELLEGQRLAEGWSAEEELTALKAMVRLANQEFLCEHYAASELWLNRASNLLPRLGEHVDSLARITWVRALLARWRGAYRVALDEATASIGYMRRMDDPEMLSRIESTAAEIMLDLAQQSRDQGDEAAFADWLARADPLLSHAIHLALVVDANASEALGRVVRARLLLLQGVLGDRTLLLEELANQGRQHQDMAFVCVAYTGIGREYEARGERDAAQEWYRKAIAALQESRAGAFTVWPRRALARLESKIDDAHEQGAGDSSSAESPAAPDTP